MFTKVVWMTSYSSHQQAWSKSSRDRWSCDVLRTNERRLSKFKRKAAPCVLRHKRLLQNWWLTVTSIWRECVSFICVIPSFHFLSWSEAGLLKMGVVMVHCYLSLVTEERVTFSKSDEIKPFIAVFRKSEGWCKLATWFCLRFSPIEMDDR